MLLGHGGGICPIEVWAVFGALSAAGGIRLLWGTFCIKCRRFFRLDEHKHEDDS